MAGQHSPTKPTMVLRGSLRGFLAQGPAGTQGSVGPQGAVSFSGDACALPEE